MIVKCPHCGSRDSGEFHIRGEAAPCRPEYGDGQAAFVEYVYGRSNVAGVQQEHWYHMVGCRSWLTVERDTRTHEIVSVTFTKEVQP